MKKDLFEAYTVPSLWHNARLDRFLRNIFPKVPHGYIERALRERAIQVSSCGGRVAAALHMQEGDTVYVLKRFVWEWYALQGPQQSHPISPQLCHRLARKFQEVLLYEDDDLVAINKPAGLASQGGKGLVEHADAMAKAWAMVHDAQRPLLVHRLDKETSGVLIFAKNRQIAQMLGRCFQAHMIQKVYWAIVQTKDPWHLPKEGEVTAPLARESFQGKETKRIACINHEPFDEAHTLYRYLQGIFDAKSACFYHWIELRPLTGRMHQLRVHCAFLGAPIVGDPRYGRARKRQKTTPPLGGMLLHARSICLIEQTVVTAPVPPSMHSWIEQMKIWRQEQ